MRSVHIRVPAAFGEPHRLAMGKYFADERTLGAREWRLVLKAMDLLRGATVHREGSTESFTSLYDRYVDGVYADSFIDQLMVMGSPMAQSEPARASVARDIVRELAAAGLHDPAIPEIQLLVAFCLYWWQSFTKGYAFEVEVFRDLRASGIRFAAHDLRDREERRSQYDLTVLGCHGDAKTSTYFLHVGSATALRHDFYITRLYDPDVREWRGVVLLREDIWRTLNGEPTPALIDEVWQVLPDVAIVDLAEGPFVIAPYETWKGRVLKRQTGDPT